MLPRAICNTPSNKVRFHFGNAVQHVIDLFQPTNGAAEELGSGFGTRIGIELLQGILHSFKNGQLDTSELQNAIDDLQRAAELLVPAGFDHELQSALNEVTQSVHLDSESLSSISALLSSLAVSLILSKVLTKEMDLGPESEVPKKYTPEALDAYFANRQFAVWSRCFSVLSEFSVFYINVLIDRATDKVQVNQKKRAIQLRNVIERLGPTYIKVAQSLSTRVDILSESYFAEIARLQDRVPPFSSQEAYDLIESELGRPVNEIFSQLTESTVASASLGQVYRGVLRQEYGGGEVAVKVQRPKVLSQVSLDLYVARLLAIYVFPKFQKTMTDYEALIDNYAVRFFQEMDYEQEAKNGILFRKQMTSIEGVVVPNYYEELTTRKVLVSEWISGEKLSESSAPDVRELCNTLLNVYLVQLLDTGFLHADPHPGNLIRTPEGKICIIDFGLMTNITKLQRDNLVEYIANLTTMNWKGVAYSLKALGFIDENSPDPVEMGLVEPLEAIFSQIVQGGGAQALRERMTKEIPNLDKVRNQLEELSKDFPFQVPSFFTLILRSFSVIEGIALGVDPSYSITMECFPYISKRILTDDDPRMHRVLKGVLYGEKSHLDIDRIERVIKALRQFTVSGLEQQSEPKTNATVEGPIINATFREALEVLFSSRGSYIQDLLVEEMVAATDALSREGLSRLAGAYMESVPAMVSLRTVEALGPLRTVLFPFLTPTEIVERIQPAIDVTKEDQEALDTVRGLLRLVMELNMMSNSLNQTAAPDFTRTLNRAVVELGPMIPDLLPGVARIMELFVRKLAARVITRAADALEKNSSELESAMKALE
eukprot:g213.t1